MKDLGGGEFEPGASSGFTLAVVSPLQTMEDVALDLGIPSCWATSIDGVNNSGSYVQYQGIFAASYSFSAVVSPKDYLFTLDTGRSKSNGRYGLPADGQSKATISTAGCDPGSYSWQQPGDPNVASIDSRGVITAGRKSGSFRVHGTACDGKCYDEIVDIGDCDSCGSGGCPATLNLGSVDVRLPLGWARGGDSAKFLQIWAEEPSTNLATPRGISYNFIRAGVGVITNSQGLRQVRMTEGLVNVLTNNPNKYTVEFYSVSNILASTGSDILYGVTNSPHTTVTVENPSNNTNQLRITYTREGNSTVSDYNWITNGWELTAGGGARREIKTIAWSETNTLKTVTYQVKDAGGTLIYQTVEKIRTNAAYYGERVIEEVKGTGPNALSNSYTWTTNGYLQQVVRADGSWNYYLYDSQNRPTNVFAACRNQGPTTDQSLCRMFGYSYATNVIPGSSDDGTREIGRPRRTIEYLLGQEVGRTYFVALPGEWREYRCVNPGAAWNNSSNLVTITTLFTNGFYQNEPRSVKRPDGTMDMFEYVIDRQKSTNTVLSGHPDSSGTNIDQGTRTLVIYDAGKLLSRTVTDVPSSIVLSTETYQYDGYGRLTNTTYLDGTSAALAYDCCGVSSETDREGTVTTYTYDSLKRRLTSTRNSITVSNAYDANGNVLSTTRSGTNGTSITLSTATFDDAGRQTSLTDALNNTTSYTNYVNSAGQTVKTTTYPNLSTRIETYNRDGSLTNVTGTAVHGLRYDYGVESESGTQRAFSKELKLDSAGSDTSEWMKTYTDTAGRRYKILYPDGAASQTYFNTNGQPVKQLDPDGVTTLLQYDQLGRLEYSAIDVNTNGAIDLAGTDRITRTVTVTTNNGVTGVQRTSTYAWATTNLDAATLISVNESSTDGLRAWSANFGLTNQIRTTYSGGHRYVTNTAADGSYSVSDYQGGRLLSATRKDSGGTQLSQTTYGYDAHGRNSILTDARTGTTTNSFDNADRVTSVSTPAPATGSPAQVTTTAYNNMGWGTNVLQPDGASVATSYYLTGEQATNSGARTYPVAYAYDYAGRLKTLTTWTNFASAAGAAVTTWNYDGQRGWLTNKAYADNKGPGYSYTAAGRLKTRTWARAVTTTNSYGSAGDLTNTVYSDSTPAVATVYDRRGRPVKYSVGSTSTTSLLYNDAGQLLSETRDGLTVTNTYDLLLRRARLGFGTNFGSTLLTNAYGYDGASRLLSVSDGTNSATYSYVANSLLVSQILFTNSGALRMTTTKNYDNLNRLTGNSSVPSADATASFNYAYSAANQRTAVTNADNSRWAYGYDSLGQVTSGKRSWSDGTLVAGQQFEYGFDDIGNRTVAASGGDLWGANLRYQNYTANSLNQYTQRTVPGYVNVLGAATNTVTVTVNLQPTSRKSNYFRGELSVDNTAAALWLGATNVAVLNNGTNADIVTTNTGNLFLPKTAELFTYDADGNLTNDGRWAYTWDGENRLLNLTANSSVPSGAKLKLDFSYDHRSRRTSKVVSTWNGSAYVGQSTNKFGYDDWNLFAEVNHTNKAVRSYLWGSDLSGSPQGAGGVGGLLAINVATNGVQLAAMDANGNVSALVNATNGMLSAQYEYGPFGELIRSSGPSSKGNPCRFSTKYQDDETDLLYYGYRYYVPTTGKWLSRDLLVERGFQSLHPRDRAYHADGPNDYAFVRNNPILATDYLGLLCIKGCPCGEAATQINAVGALRAYQARSLANDAFSATRRTGLSGAHNGPADAFRHCFWSCRMAQELNPGLAEIIGNIHERCGEGPAAEAAMDLANNASGRAFGTRGADCYNLCLGAVYEGTLVTSPSGKPPSLMYCY